MSCQRRLGKMGQELQVSNTQQPTLQQSLSLQQASILCVISNLENFPPDILALLPLKFRRDLLLLLPPADIFQLEHTSVANGIDMENEIWKEVYERYDYEVARTAHIDPDEPRYSHVMQLPKAVESRKQIVSTSAPLTWKASFLSCIFTFLLHMKPFKVNTGYENLRQIYSSSAGERNYIVFLQLLFCIQFFTLKQISSQGLPLHEFGTILQLSRYHQFFTSIEPLQIPHWIHFLLVKCHLEAPCLITVDEQYFSWDETNMANESHNAVIFQNFFRSVKNVKLHLYCQYLPEGIPRPQIDTTIRKVLWLFDRISSCHQSGITQLESVGFDECVVPFQEGCILYRGSDNHMLNSVLEKLFSHPVLSLQGVPAIVHQFHTLKHVQITGFAQIEMSTICSLLVLLQNKALETIFLSGQHIVGDEIQQAHLQQTLWSTFSSPISSTCTSITLNKISKLPLSVLLWLVQKFLYSPSNGLQTLTLTDCEIDYSIDPDENILKCIPPSSCLALPHKSLHISQLNVKPALIKALSSLPSVVLDNLQLDFSSCWNNEVKPTDFFDALLNTDSNHKIKRLFYRFSKCYSYRDPKTSLKPDEVELIKTLFSVAQQFPETAITLQCETSASCIETLFCYLHTEWKKNSRSRKLEKLLINFDSVATTDEPHFQSLLESVNSTHPINILATTVEVSLGQQKCSLQG